MIQVKSESILAIKRNAQFIKDGVCAESGEEANLIRNIATNILKNISMIEQVMAVVRSSTKKEGE